jgi:hypothetical protein
VPDCAIRAVTGSAEESAAAGGDAASTWRHEARQHAGAEDRRGTRAAAVIDQHLRAA